MYYKTRSPYGHPEVFSSQSAITGSSRSSSVTSSSGLTGSQETSYFPSPGPSGAMRDGRKKSKLSHSDRKAICEYHVSNPKLKQDIIAHQFGVERSTVSKVLRQKEKWLSIMPASVPTARTYKPRTSKYPQLELSMTAWIEAQDPTLFLTDAMIREQALRIARAQGITEDLFKASAGWLEKFKERNNIEAGKWNGQRIGNPSMSDPITDFNDLASSQATSQATSVGSGPMNEHFENNSQMMSSQGSEGPIPAMTDAIGVSCPSPPKTHHYALRHRQQQDQYEAYHMTNERPSDLQPRMTHGQNDSTAAAYKSNQKFTTIQQCCDADSLQSHLRRHPSGGSTSSAVSSMTDLTATNTETASTAPTSSSGSSQFKSWDQLPSTKRAVPRVNQSLADALGPAFAKAVSSSNSFTDLASRVSSEKHVSMSEAQGALSTVMQFLNQQPNQSSHMDNQALGNLWSKIQGLRGEGAAPHAVETRQSHDSTSKESRARSVSPPSRPHTPVHRHGRMSASHGSLEQLAGMMEPPVTRRRSRLRQSGGHVEGDSTP